MMDTQRQHPWHKACQMVHLVNKPLQAKPTLERVSGHCDGISNQYSVCAAIGKIECFPVVKILYRPVKSAYTPLC